VFIFKNNLAEEDARRIQSSQDKEGDDADQGFKARAQRAAAKNK